MEEPQLVTDRPGAGGGAASHKDECRTRQRVASPANERQIYKLAQRGKVAIYVAAHSFAWAQGAVHHPQRVQFMVDGGDGGGEVHINRAVGNFSRFVRIFPPIQLFRSRLISGLLLLSL